MIKRTCGGKLSGILCNASRYTANARCSFPCSAYKPPNCNNVDTRALLWAVRSLNPAPSNLEPSRNTEAASWQRPNDISDVPKFKYATAHSIALKKREKEKNPLVN